jgi:hypothetical protein
MGPSQIFNQYSLVWLALAVLLTVGLLLFRNRIRLPELVSFGLIVLALVAAWVAIRPRSTPLMGDAANVQAMIGGGTPVLLEFQSPY